MKYNDESHKCKVMIAGITLSKSNFVIPFVSSTIINHFVIAIQHLQKE